MLAGIKKDDEVVELKELMKIQEYGYGRLTGTRQCNYNS